MDAAYESVNGMIAIAEVRTINILHFMTTSFLYRTTPSRDRKHTTRAILKYPEPAIRPTFTTAHKHLIPNYLQIPLNALCKLLSNFRRFIGWKRLGASLARDWPFCFGTIE